MTLSEHLTTTMVKTGKKRPSKAITPPPPGPPLTLSSQLEAILTQVQNDTIITNERCILRMTTESKTLGQQKGRIIKSFKLYYDKLIGFEKTLNSRVKEDRPQRITRNRQDFTMPPTLISDVDLNLQQLCNVIIDTYTPHIVALNMNYLNLSIDIISELKELKGAIRGMRDEVSRIDGLLEFNRTEIDGLNQQMKSITMKSNSSMKSNSNKGMASSTRAVLNTPLKYPNIPQAVMDAFAAPCNLQTDMRVIPEKVFCLGTPTCIS